MGKRQFEKNSIIVLILTTIGSAINYLCQILMGRLLTVDSFGTVNAIFSVMNIVGVLGTTASMLISKAVAERISVDDRKGGAFYVIGMMKALCVGSAFLFLAGIGVLVLTRSILYIKDIKLIILSLIAVMLNLFPIFFQGVFGGFQKFILLGFYTLIVPVIKLLGVLGVQIALFENDAQSIMGIVIVANCLAMGIGFGLFCVIAGSDIRLSNSLSIVKIFGMDKYYIDSLTINIIMMFLMNIDILYLKLFCGAEYTGYYSSAVMFGRIIYYCVTALASVLLPMVAFSKNDDKFAFVMLKKTILFVVIMSVVLLIPVNIWGKELLCLIYGIQYIEAARFVGYASLISVGTSLNTILVNYMLGIDKLGILKKCLGVGSILLFIFIEVLRNNPWKVLTVIGVISFIIFILNLRVCCREK